MNGLSHIQEHGTVALTRVIETTSLRKGRSVVIYPNIAQSN